MNDAKRGKLAYALTKRMVIDMPSARALVDDAVNDSDGCPHGFRFIVNDCLRCGAPICCGRCCSEDALLEGEATDDMVYAYLEANTAYWEQTDKIPTPPGRWRTGTPKEATKAGLRAVLELLKRKEEND
jgi:hypothetical protein